MCRVAVLAGLIPDDEASQVRVTFVTEREASLRFCIQSGLPAGVMKVRYRWVLILRVRLLDTFSEPPDSHCSPPPEIELCPTWRTPLTKQQNCDTGVKANHNTSHCALSETNI